MKKCPFCAEEIQDEAIKCKHCQELLPQPPGQKWYFKMHIIIIAFACVGPLVLPLIWFHPSLSQKKKTIITIIVILLSLLLGAILIQSLKSILQYYRIIFEEF